MIDNYITSRSLPTLFPSLNRINLPTSELSLARSSATSAVLSGRSTGRAARFASVDGVDLAVGKLAGANATVWLTVLAEAVVL